MRKDWNSYVGRKFDMLTVAEVIAPAMAQKMLNLSYKQTHFVCVCDCGAVRYAAEILLADKGWTYRTREEAEAALPGVAKELGVEHEL